MLSFVGAPFSSLRSLPDYEHSAVSITPCSRLAELSGAGFAQVRKFQADDSLDLGLRAERGLGRRDLRLSSVGGLEGRRV